LWYYEYIVKSSIRNFAHQFDIAVSEEYINKLDAYIEKLTEDAINKANENNRKTLKSIDLPEFETRLGEKF